MRVEFLIKRLEKLPKDSKIVFSNDEEINAIFDNCNIMRYDTEFSQYVLLPHEASERTQELYQTKGE